MILAHEGAGSTGGGNQKGSTDKEVLKVLTFLPITGAYEVLCQK